MVSESFTLQDVEIEINGTIVGGAQALSATYAQENKPILEGGTHKPREILDGSIAINGSVERLFLDVDLIKSVIDLEDGTNPYVDIVGVTKNKTPERRVTIVSAKFKGFNIEMGLTDETKNTMEFDALDINLK